METNLKKGWSWKKVLISSLIAAMLLGVIVGFVSDYYEKQGQIQSRFCGQLREFCGENKKVNLFTTDKKLAQTISESIAPIKDAQDKGKAEKAIDGLNKIIKKNPNSSEAYLLRAMLRLQVLASTDYSQIMSDLNNAIKNKTKESIFSEAEMYSMRGKANKRMGNYGQALDDLETAINFNAGGNPSAVVNVSGVKAEEAKPEDLWTKNDFDEIINKLPSDFRGNLFRGYFYSYFATFDEKYYALAMQDYEEAIRLNPKAALSYSLLGGLYSKAAFWKKEVWADLSGKVRDGYNLQVVQAMSKAIEVDPKFKNAYLARAEAYYSLKEYKLAIQDYDKFLDFEPEAGGVYNDRGLAHHNLGDYFSAVTDFDRAVRAKNPPSYLGQTYQNRANANIKIGNSDEAVTDYSRAIELSLADAILLMTADQIRAIYPEFNTVSDKTMAKMLWRKLNPTLSYEDFGKSFLTKKEYFRSTTIPELYVNRGDVYLNAGQYRKAIKEYDRAAKGFPDYAKTMDRWRLPDQMHAENYFIDIQTLELPNSKNNIASVFVKVEDNSQPDNPVHAIQKMEIDCSSKKIRTSQLTGYSANGTSEKISSGKAWSDVMPDSRGEMLYKGACEK